jgi:hypothetical protein
MSQRPRFVLTSIPRFVLAFDAGFSEQEHPRGQRENKGQFVKKGQQSGKSPPQAKSPEAGAKPPEGAKPPPPITLKPAKGRAWSGKPNLAAAKLSKLEAGDLGERIVVAWLKSKGLDDAQPLNVKQKNFPIDLIGDHQVHEVKTGQVSTSAGAAQWRATIGQPGKQETEDLKHMTPEQKAAHNAVKNAAIMARKQRIVQECSQKYGRKIAPKTITVILDPDRGIADIHQFDGFHQRIGYNSPQAQQGYVGSFSYR